MASPKKQDNSDQALSQADLDNLFAGGGGGEGGSEAPGEDGGSGGSLDQSDLDSLFAGGGDDDSGAEPPGKDAGSGTLDQSDLDSLFAGGGDDDSGAEPPGKDAGSGTLDQSDLDSLFAGGEDSESEPEASPDPEPGLPDETADGPSGDADEEEMDRLIAELAAEQPADPGNEPAPNLVETDAGPSPTTPALPLKDAGQAADGQAGSVDETGIVDASASEPGDDFVPLDDDDLDISGYGEAGGGPKEATGGETTAGAETAEAPAPSLKKEKKKAPAARKGAKGRRPGWLLAGIALVFLVAGGTGAWLIHGKWKAGAGKVASGPVASAPSTAVPAPDPAKSPAPAEPVLEKDDAEPPTASPAQILPPGLEKGLAALDALRSLLTTKQSQLEALRKEYSGKVRQAEEEIRAEARRRGITTLKAARSVRGIELQLKTVQRRLAYVRSLDGPSARLSEGSEELLFVRRLTEIDWQLADAAMGMDTKLLEKRLYESIRKHRIAPGALVVDVRPERYPSMETVWKRLGIEPAKRKAAPVPTVKKASVPETVPLPRAADNAQILKEMSAGNFENLSLLTQLTPAAARDLSKWQGKELFLTNLTHLSSQEAAYLAQWPGRWLALNGLAKLSPDVARQLMRWKGDRISLNGLRQIGAETARYLCQWEGKQIEVVGLERLYPDTARLLTKWQRRGGRVFVPERFKRKPGRTGPAAKKG